MRAIEKRTLLTFDASVDINRHLHFHHERMKNVHTTIDNNELLSINQQGIPLPKILPKNKRRLSLSKSDN